ncbi:acyltransferase domain-containing protein [Streptomyces sp. SID335]|nr:type I polyketide synthase [Streptomyces sp. SID335]MYY80794.1 acyltransferase domain-containing protein [Streptomyces sp. SID335]
MASEEELVDYLKRVAAELHDTRQRLREVEDRRQEPVAVVGMACRFPGGIETPEGLWDLVAAGDDAIEPFPTDRGWDLEGIYHPDPDHPGTCYVREGGFLTAADRFDSDFFGFSPREALASSPQLRLLLETSWEALERAGIDPATLKGSPTGVYVGAATTGNQTQGDAGGKATEGYAGTAPSVLSGRVSFTLGLEGPAVTVETACSSSLVAMHLAANALRQGECDLALAGGVTIMSTPEVFTGFSRQRGLAPNGRCKPFAASADGTGWGEGAGLILLERLSDARRNGHDILAVIRGSAINQDGASNGFTAPNGPSQRRVIRQALAGANLSTSEIDVVEAHGTGTKLGDPIEAEALIATYGKEREDDRPLWLGSVKSNIGHTQAAAGVAGVIKMVMALRRELLPATLNVDEPTPHVQWEGGGVRLLTEPVPWARGDRPRRAGVSSFGISGTNAHVILEEAPEASALPVEEASPGAVVPWVLSGRSEEALREQAHRLHEFAAGDGAEALPGEVGWSLATTRSVFENRAVVVGRDRDELVTGVATLAAGEASPDVVSGVASGDVGPGPVLVFPGQGSQWVGMGAQLLEESPVFAARIGECERALSEYVDWSLTEVLRGDGGELSRVEVVQPVLWAVMVSLAAVWADQGIVPAAVIGHSQGEMAAACVAGALSLEDAARVVAVRSDALRQLQGHGDMASVGTSAERVVELIGDRPGVSVAAVNGPSSTVISGSPEHVAAVVAEAKECGLRARVIDVGYASHNPQIDALHDLLSERLADIRPVSTDVAFYSTVTAERLADTTALDTAYWITNLRQPVRFAETVEALLADGYRLFIEASAHPVLALGMEETIERADVPATVVPTLRRDHGDTAQLTRAAAQAFTAGADIDWRRWFPADPTPRTVDLPTYAFQRRRYWLPVDGVGDVRSAGLRRLEHTLLPAALGLADGALVLTGRLSASGGGDWLADHAVAGTTLVPGAALVEWALQAADEAGCTTLEELTLQAPLVLPGNGGLQVQVVVGAADEQGGRREVRVFSRAEAESATEPGTEPGNEPGTEPGGGQGRDEDWLCHATGVLSPDPGDVPEGLSGQWPPTDAEPVQIGDLYERAASAGYEYGPSFRGLRAVWRQGRDLLAEVRLPEQAGSEDGFGIHPVLLDAALHPALLLADDTSGEHENGNPNLPFAWNGVSLWATGAATVRVRLTPYEDGGEDEGEGGGGGGGALRVTVADAMGAPVLSVDSLALRPADPELLRSAGRTGGVTPNLFTVEWTALPSAAAVGANSNAWAVLGRQTPAWADPDTPHYLDLPALLAFLDEGAQAPATVLVETATPSSGTVDARGRAAAEHILGLLRDWLAEPRLTETRLVLVTHGAVPVATAAPDDDRNPGCIDVPASALWGLIRAAQAEHPDRFVLLDIVDAVDADASAAAVAAALATDEPQLAVRRGVALAPRLARATAQTGTTANANSNTETNTNTDTETDAKTDTEAESTLTPNGTVLIAGGTGMMGALVAEHLVSTWAVRHLLLVSRQGPDAPGARELTDRLTGLGAAVRIVAADLTDARATADLVASVDPAHPLTGVIHAAGVLDDAVVTAQTDEQLARVWAAKASVAANLDAATTDLPLGLFLMFSSAAGVLGNAGQAGYAAANAFVDALVARRRATGLPGLSIAWGLWARGSAMTRHLDDADLARLRAGGVKPLLDEQGLALLDAARAAATHTSLLVAAGIDVRELSADDVPAILRNLAGRTRRRAAADTAVEQGALERRLAGLDQTERRAAVTDVVRECVAAVLGHRSASDVRTEANFKDLGFDSLTAVQLRNRLSAASGLRLPATLAFDHPTPQALAAHLCTRLGGATAAPATPSSAAPPVPTTDDPVAIVAMACKYPGGVTTPEGLWDLVEAGVDTVGAFPTTRGWDLERLFHPDPDHPGTSYADEGAFLPDAGDFDAAFFGINPREALAMDPQQRLLLEASWEVFERAGIDPTTLKGSLTGTYVGVMYHDYAAGLAQDAQLEGYSMLAGSGSVVSGRVSYTLGLEGPAVTVDTACSSSLVSIHLAAQALRQGECDLALAGGVTVMATPEVFTGFSRQRGLAPDGRCKPFAAAADGTGWGEGVGVLLLERLSDARRRGRRVLGVVRGSAVNQDGASNGLTAPNGPSQERVIRQALASGGLSVGDVDVVEGHGTGTTLGDPIEAQALLATYGQGRSVDRPVWLGSVKSNIGHTQAAAGVAGVIKMVMAMRRGVVPASLHVDVPTPHVDWESGGVRLAVEAVPWPGVRDGGVRRAGVSSFGASGTNAHVIVEYVPEPVAEVAVEPEGGAVGDGVLVPWVVSARSARALRDQARRLSEAVTRDSAVAIRDVGWSLLRSRSLFDHRAVVIGSDRSELVAGIEALATDEAHPALTQSGESAAAQRGDMVWLFSGQGSQVVGMGAGLYERFPVFAEAFDEVCGLLDAELGGSVRGVVFGGPRERLDHTMWAQAGLFALQVGLARLWESVGVRPDVVVGHSVGEIAAAYVAGVFGLADACKVVGARARLMGGLPEGGAMCAVQAAPEELAADLEGSAVSIAAVNTPDSTVISGPADEVEKVTGLWRGRGRKTKALAVSHAFHSVLMEPMLADFTEAIRDVKFAAPRVPLMSNVTGREAGAEITAPEYWAEHVRQAVLFQPAITEVADRAGAFVELGPAPVLATATQHTLDAVADPHGEFEPVVTASLRHSDLPDDVAFAQAMARLHTAGIAVDWSGWFPADASPRTVDLPTYPFQGRRFWLADVAVPGVAPVADGKEAGFWAAVEGADVQALCDTLHLKDDAHRTALETVFPALSAWRRERLDRSTVDAWRYRVDWRRVELPTPAPGTGSWLVLAPKGGAEAWSRTCVRALEEAGAPVRLVEVGTGAGRAELTDLIRSWRSTCADDDIPLTGVLSLLALDDGTGADTDTDTGARPGFTGASATLALLQGLLKAEAEAEAEAGAGADVALWCATRGAVSCGDTDPVVSPEQAPVWGIGRVAALEHPELWGGLLDLPGDPDTLDPAALYAVLCGDSGEDQVALRRGGVLGRRLVPDAPTGDETAPTAGRWRPEGAVLVTGGVGRLTEQVVRWLAASGAEHVVLLDTAPEDGRGSDRAERDSGLAAEVASHGARFTVLAPPYGSRGRAGGHDRTLAQLTDVDIRTVIHTSLPGELAPLAEVTPDALDAATAAAGELGDLVAADTVLYFSSVAATLGSREHGAYAAANAYLDALAQRHGDGGAGPRTVSVGWGIWDLPEDGDLARGAAGLSRRQGLPPLEPRLALSALHTVLDAGRGHGLVADIEWDRFAPLFTLARPTRLLDEVPAARRVLDASSDSAGSAEVAVKAAALRRELAALPVRERSGRLLDVVREQVSGVLRYEPGQEVEPEKAFKDLGFDSLVVVELRNRLRAATGLRLPATLVYDYPTPRALAEHLLDKVLPDGGAGELPVAGHLADLEEALAGLAVDDPRRRGLVRRLQTLLWKQPDFAAAPLPADGEDGQGGTDDLSAASADDMFALIDREWGTQ